MSAAAGDPAPQPVADDEPTPSKVATSSKKPKFVLGRMNPLPSRSGAKTASTTTSGSGSTITSTVVGGRSNVGQPFATIVAKEPPTNKGLVQPNTQIWPDPKSPEHGFLLEMDGVLLGLLSQERNAAPAAAGGEEREELPETSSRDVIFAMTMGKMLALPYDISRWSPKLKRVGAGKSKVPARFATRISGDGLGAEGDVTAGDVQQQQQKVTGGHFWCYSLSNAMLGKECVHVPVAAFERAFCPCAIYHPPLLNLRANAVALATGALANYPLVQHLLSNAVGKGEGILVGACLMGHYHLVKQFLHEGLDSQLFHVFEGVSSFQAAACSGSVPLMKLLLDLVDKWEGKDLAAGVEGATGPKIAGSRKDVVKKQNRFHENCLHIALRCGHRDLADLLLDEGCPPDASAVCRSITYPLVHPIADRLLKGHADIRNLSALDHSQSPLAVACNLLLEGGTDRYAWILLKGQDAHPDVGKVLGRSPLLLAAEARHYPLVFSLVEAGANINATNDDGETVLHIAAKYWEESEDEEIKKLENGSSTCGVGNFKNLREKRFEDLGWHYYYLPPTTAERQQQQREAQEQKDALPSEPYPKEGATGSTIETNPGTSTYDAEPESDWGFLVPQTNSAAAGGIEDGGSSTVAPAGSILSTAVISESALNPNSAQSQLKKHQQLREKGKAMDAISTLKMLIFSGADPSISNHSYSDRWKLAKEIAQHKKRSFDFRQLLH